MIATVELAKAAENPEQYQLIMGVLHGRLQERGENWRMCYKALLVLEYLCKQGPLVRMSGGLGMDDRLQAWGWMIGCNCPVQRVAGDLLRSVHILEALRDMFEYKDEKGKDQVCAPEGGIWSSCLRETMGHGC